ncbi:hypothetical protein PV05_06974 [Exophiala xenobiotica]|uniref:JmjC domain-containing protein n=1 Tax=Exophiala xenobiotica TaxID=348802 RepID=A0A0D2EIZ5_9EURO|nr:uncharacterized protein PV05_06974 [Exophiala xenobiotica]KIW54625.1 hypothetical protein PV05_06974 [Exophiala xenobiotica]
MADLATVMQSIRKIDATLGVIRTTLQRHVPAASRLSGKSRKRAQPHWTEALSLQLSNLSNELDDVKKEMQRGSAISDTHCHNVNSAELDAAQDGRTRISKQPQDKDEQLAQRAPTLPPSSPTNASSVPAPDMEVRQQAADGVPWNNTQTTAPEIASSLGFGQSGPAGPGREVAKDMTPSQLVSCRASPLGGQLDFSLSVEDMGEKLVPNIMRLINDDRFTGILSVQGIGEIDWTNLMRSIRPPEKTHEILGVKYSKPHPIKGVAELRLSTPRNFAFPDFSQTIKEPSREACLDYLRQVINNPPESTIPYYIGLPLTPTFDHLLHPGEPLLNISLIDGLNKVYWYAGEEGSGSPFHCEDWKLYSYNLVLYGWKLWIMIRLSHTKKFEAFIRKCCPSNSCDQFVRHNSLLVSPETLQKHGIEFDIHVAGPGQMVVTRPEQYHAVVNITRNMAIAINFAPPDRAVRPDDLCVCSKCGLYALQCEGIRKVPSEPTLPASTNLAGKRQGSGDASHLREKRQRREDPIQPRKKRRIGGNAAKSQTSMGSLKTTQSSQALRKTVEQIKEIDKLCHLPSLREKPPVHVLKLIAAIGSRVAIQQFITLVADRRDLSNTTRMDTSGDPSSRAMQYAHRIKISERKSMLERFLIRVNQVSFVQELDRSKNGRIRVDEKLLRVIEKRTGWSTPTLEHHRKMGNKWKRICGDFDGLLCFIFLDPKNPFSVLPEQYQNMNDEDLEIFHRLLKDDYFDSIRSAGKAFQKSLNSAVADIEFCWESRKAPLGRLSEAELLLYLNPFPTVSENIYDEGKFSKRPRPPAWPEDWQWPEDPTWLHPDSRQCDLCLQTKCDCIKTKIASKLMPRIKDYGPKGRGLQAVAHAPGYHAYKKGDILGELTGVLEPLGRYRSDTWTLEMVREDLDDQNHHQHDLRVCQIRCADKSSYFRLANHACRPSVRLVGKPISGRYRWVFIAARHILHGDEITGNFGKRSLRGTNCLCIDCAAE